MPDHILTHTPSNIFFRIHIPLCGQVCDKTCGQMCGKTFRQVVAGSCVGSRAGRCVGRLVGRCVGRCAAGVQQVCGKTCGQVCGKTCGKVCGKVCGQMCGKTPAPFFSPFSPRGVYSSNFPFKTFEEYTSLSSPFFLFPPFLFFSPNIPASALRALSATLHIPYDHMIW